MADGEICHVEGGTGGVSLPDVDRLRLADGGVPIAKLTLGGDIELISKLQLLLRRFDCFILIGCERGIPLGAVVHCYKKKIKKYKYKISRHNFFYDSFFFLTTTQLIFVFNLLLVVIGVERFFLLTEQVLLQKWEVYLVLED